MSVSVAVSMTKTMTKSMTKSKSVTMSKTSEGLKATTKDDGSSKATIYKSWAFKFKGTISNVIIGWTDEDNSIDRFVRFNAISRIVRGVASDGSLDWDISGTGLELSDVFDLFIISVGSLVGDDWNLTSLSCDLSLVLSLVDSVESSLSLSSVLGLVLNSHVLIENCLVSCFSFLSVKDLVLVGETGLWLISVVSDSVISLEDLDLSSVSVLFLLLILDCVVSLVGDIWDIFPVSLGIVSEDLNWLPGVSVVVVWSVLDLVLGGISHLSVSSVLGLVMSASSGDWDLSGSDFSLNFGENVVFNLIVVELDVSESDFLATLDVGVFVGIVVAGRSEASKNGRNEFHGWRSFKYDYNSFKFRPFIAPYKITDVKLIFMKNTYS